jgi:outer membrane immunogenic protein
MKTRTFSKLCSIRIALGGLAALLVAGCAATTTAPNTQPAATLSLQLKSVAYYGSAMRGTGVLNFQGQRRNFTISSVGIGGTGGQNISATGKVFNLTNLSAFNGGYRGVSRGLTLMEGKMYAKLTNEKGVVIYLTGDTKGLATSGGVQQFQINLTN